MDKSSASRATLADIVRIALLVLLVNVLLIVVQAQKVKRLNRGMGGFHSRDRADIFYEAIQLQTLILLPREHEEHFHNIYHLLTTEAVKWNLFPSQARRSTLLKFAKKLSSHTFPLHEQRSVIALDNQDTSHYIFLEGVSAYSHIMSSSGPTDMAVRTWAKIQLNTLRQTYGRAPIDVKFHSDLIITHDVTREKVDTDCSQTVVCAADTGKLPSPISQTNECRTRKGYKVSPDRPSGARQGFIRDPVDQLIAEAREAQCHLNTSNPAANAPMQDSHDLNPSNGVKWTLLKECESEWRSQELENRTLCDPKDSQTQMAKDLVYEEDSWDKVLSLWRRETAYFGASDAEDDYP